MGGLKIRADRGTAAIIALAALLAAGFPAASAAAPASAERNLERVRQMEAADERKDCKTILELGVPLVEAKAESGLTGEAEAYAYELVVSCEYRAKAHAAAYAHALKGTKLEHSTDYLWQMRLVLELLAERRDAAVATIEAMTQGRGAALNSAPIQLYSRLERELREKGLTALRRRLLKVLASDVYAPEAYYGPTDYYAYLYAGLLADEGETAAARAMLARLETPTSLSSAMLDPRLRGLLAGEPDIRAAAERALAGHREAMARHPDRLEPLTLAAADLRQLGRPAEAVQLLETATARIADSIGFADLDEQLNWWWDALGRSHAALGHYEPMVDSFRKGAAAGEGGEPNVSQVINLASTQVSFGRGDEALKTLAVFEDPKRALSPYGAMEMRYARGCAHAVAGRPETAAADLAFARAHEKDHPEALADLLLCLGDMDGAAAAFIRRLDDPERRIAALLQLSDYDPPPVPLPTDPVASRLPALKQRPDVRAAIERAGGIRRFRVQAGEL
ncbi:MAG TPA: hypothetical protein VFZ91_00100 [Allosphingosinicella sp.]